MSQFALEFSRARRRGQHNFCYKGELYHTRLYDENYSDWQNTIYQKQQRNKKNAF